MREVRAHAANLGGHGRFTRKSSRKHADVGRRAADVGDQRITQPREVGGAAHGVGRSRGEGQHWIPGHLLGAHQRAVVLADEKRCPSMPRERSAAAKCGDDLAPPSRRATRS